MRILGLAVVLAFGWAGAAWAFDDPAALARAIYEPYQSGRKPADLDAFYSQQLRGMFANAAERDAVGPLDNGEAAKGPAEFDPFVADENYLIHDLAIGEPQVLGERATVSVRYYNFDHPSLVTLSLVREADGWKVDDVASLGQDEHWLLSWLLTYDPFDN